MNTFKETTFQKKEGWSFTMSLFLVRRVLKIWLGKAYIVCMRLRYDYSVLSLQMYCGHVHVIMSFFNLLQPVLFLVAISSPPPVLRLFDLCGCNFNHLSHLLSNR